MVERWVDSVKTYEELKARRNELTDMLREHSDLKGHRTYKKMEEELHQVKGKIKQIFREDYHGKQR
jgi:hypothetical protein